MAYPIRRRDFLVRSSQVAAGIALSPSILAAHPASLKLERLNDKVFVVSGAGGNVTVLDTPEGIALVDGGLAEHSAQLLEFIGASTGGRPVQMLFNTHWHWEHTGANASIRKLGRKVIAHENTRLWLGAEVDLKWQGRVYPPLAAQARPDEGFYTTIEKSIGGQQIRCGVMPQAHTDGDIYVHLPESNVLIAGDVVTAGQYPILDYCTGGWICGMLDATRKLLELSDTQTRVVPGTGPVQTRAQLEAQLAMLTEMAARLVDLMRKGMSAEDMLAAAPSRDFDARWGDPALFITNAYPGLWGHVRDLATRGYSGVV